MRTIEIYINSYLDRLVDELESSSKRFTALFDKEIRVFPDEKNITLKLGSIELPNILYNFSFVSSRLWIVDNVSDPEAATLEFIEINTERVYVNPEELIDELNSLIIAHPTLSNIEFNYIDNEKKITITNNAGHDIRLVSSFRYQDTNNGVTFNDMNDRIGFTQDLRNTIISHNQTLKAQGLVKMLRTNCFYLTCDNISSSFNQNIIPNPKINPRILARLSTSDFGTLSQLSFASQVDFNITNEGSIRSMTFSLLDDEFREVDLDQFPITFSLILTIS